MGKIRAKKTSRVHLKASQLTSVTVGADATANFPKPLTKNEDGVHKVDTSANNTSSYGYATVSFKLVFRLCRYIIQETNLVFLAVLSQGDV